MSVEFLTIYGYIALTAAGVAVFQVLAWTGQRRARRVLRPVAPAVTPLRKAA